MTPENIAKEKREREEFKKECFEKWRNNKLARIDHVHAKLRGWDLRGWVLDWERGKQMKWKPAISWDWE